MRKFEVKVNGRQYVVEVDETTEAPQSEGAAKQTVEPQTVAMAPAASTPTATVAATNAPAPAAPVSQGVAEGFEVNAPLRGQIVRVAVKPGDTVKRGQVLCSIEALKLENEISSPVAGVVTGVFTQSGASINSGDVLITISENA